MAIYTDSETQSLDYSDDTSDDGLYGSNIGVPSYRLTRFTRPLIDYVRNEWQTSAKYSHLPSSHDRSDTPRWLQMVLSIVTAPRFRRYVLVYLSLLISCFVGWKFVLSPRLQEHASLLRALDPNVKEEVGGWFGTNALPSFDYIVQLRTLDPALLPAETSEDAGDRGQRRLIMIGDVHGCKSELDRLLEEVAFDQEHDHLVFTGDMINKGPDSLGVVDLARQYSASCVRGNHEDRVLLLRHEMFSSNSSVNASLGDPDGEPFLPQDTQERQLARNLTDEQAEWLDTCPVILDVGRIPTMGEVVVVHAGLVPGVDLEKQDPYSVMNMRTVDLDTHVPSASRTGTKWTKLFNKHQSLLYNSLKNSAPEELSTLRTVIYGHDSKSSLSLKKYTKGLDTGCVKGGKLTAMVIGSGGEQKVVQVRCNDYSST
ncbi:Ser/Thr protein phosphatase family [Aspergillus ambiguus]|uniref:putative serine/threonine-protein phosphatase n=1 Tax=Aspergillus ambiguus TaxID=176160 RepID=UPI003CCD3BFD